MPTSRIPETVFHGDGRWRSRDSSIAITGGHCSTTPAIHLLQDGECAGMQPMALCGRAGERWLAESDHAMFFKYVDRRLKVSTSRSTRRR